MDCIVDSSALRTAFSQVPSGVVAVCAATDGERIGMLVSTFVPVSLDPPLVAFCVQHSSETWPRLARLPRMGISVLGTDHATGARTLAAKGVDRFSGLRTETQRNGAMFVADCVVKMDVSIVQQIEAGDHLIVVLNINELNCSDDRVTNTRVEPMVFHRSEFRRLATP